MDQILGVVFGSIAILLLIKLYNNRKKKKLKLKINVLEKKIIHEAYCDLYTRYKKPSETLLEVELQKLGLSEKQVDLLEVELTNLLTNINSLAVRYKSIKKFYEKGTKGQLSEFSQLALMNLYKENKSLFDNPANFIDFMKSFVLENYNSEHYEEFSIWIDKSKLAEIGAVFKESTKKNMDTQVLMRFLTSYGKVNQKTLKSHFHSLAKEHHPDNGGDEDLFKQINEDYKLLLESI